MGEVRVVVRNRKAKHDYHILETYEAGIVLTGTEVKSLRAGNVSLADAYAKVENGEVFLYNMYIAPYDKGNIFNPDPRRPRKLLLHEREIKKLYGKTQERGLTLVPLSIYFNERGWAKVELALAKGKKIYDKKEAIKERETKREIERHLQ